MKPSDLLVDLEIDDRSMDLVNYIQEDCMGATKIATIDRLKSLGFICAAIENEKKYICKRKMAVAYELFRFVRPEKIAAFNEKLRKESHNWDGFGGRHELSFLDISDYRGIPPPKALDKLAHAQLLTVGGIKVFDHYDVAYIREITDPILFGRIEGCSDRFFIAQWDNDVKIEDILSDNEG